MPITQRQGSLARKTGADRSAAPSARSGGVAVAPPACGIAFVDRTAPAPVNHTGLPDALKAGIESLSGLSLDTVRVHYNSAQPARHGPTAAAACPRCRARRSWFAPTAR